MFPTDFTIGHPITVPNQTKQIGTVRAISKGDKDKNIAYYGLAHIPINNV